MRHADIPPIPGGSIIQQVVLVDRLDRERETQFEAGSLPGHLIQVMISGRARLESNGRLHDLGPGLAVWYHQDELVRGQVLETPWSYYTVNFLAPTLSPPSFDQRVKAVTDMTVHCFQRLLEAWRDTTVAVPIRHVRVHARLLDLLLELLPLSGTPFRMDLATRLWWDLETRIRTDLTQPIDLNMIHKLTRKSLRTIIRSCHCAVGMAPMRRVKMLRLSMARGLVLYSELKFTEIASRVGYSRVHEFSRDYHKEFGLTPTDDRAAGPDYRVGRTQPKHRGIPAL